MSEAFKGSKRISRILRNQEMVIGSYPHDPHDLKNVRHRKLLGFGPRSLGETETRETAVWWSPPEAALWQREPDPSLSIGTGSPSASSPARAYRAGDDRRTAACA